MDDQPMDTSVPGVFRDAVCGQAGGRACREGPGLWKDGQAASPRK